MEQTVQFHLEDFDGPLDLLLALVAKNKMSIYDIEIMTLIDQYMQVVDQAGLQDMDSMSEFVSMAARFVQMKSYLLLPKSDEAERMKEELTGLLVEYSACKRVAGQLGEMAKGIFIAVRKPVEVEPDFTYKHTHKPAALLRAYMNMKGRISTKKAPRQEQFEEIVSAPFVSVSSRVVHVLRGLVTGKVQKLKQLFVKGSDSTRGETVATFLAVLELIRGGRLQIDEQEELVLKRKIENISVAVEESDYE